MNPGTSLWLRTVNENGRVFSWIPHQCPSAAQPLASLAGGSGAQGAVGIATQIVQTAAMVGIWYELHKMRNLQNELLSLQEAAFEERKLGWLAEAMKAWVTSHQDQPGLQIDSCIALRKQLLAVMTVLRDHPRTDAPQVLVLAASRLQEGLSPRARLAYDIHEEQRLHVLSLASRGLVKRSKSFDRRMKYSTGVTQTVRWLEAKSQRDLDDLKEELDNTFFVQIPRKRKLSKNIEQLERSQEITRRFMPFQNLINELGNVINISQSQKAIVDAIPSSEQLELYAVAKQMPANFWRRLLFFLPRQPVFDTEKKNQMFELRAVRQRLLE